MSTIRRRLGVLLACLPALALSACGGGGLPETRIGTLEVQHYVALGDGFAAAPFAGETLPAKGCLRSDVNYPTLVAAEVDAQELEDVTCLFATTAGVTRSHTPVRGKKGPVPAQIESVTAETDLITLTIGLNDRDFMQRLFDICIDDCDETDGVHPDELVQDLAQIGVSVRETVQAVTKRAPDARLYVIGYPPLLPRSDKCDAMPDLTQNEVDGINAALVQLNGHLRAAALESDGDFVDVAEIARGHDMCADEPWIQGDVIESGQVPRFHPLPQLQQAIADDLVDDLKP